MPETIATVVVTYNRLNLLIACIFSIRNQTQKSDIIVINNGSTDETAAWLNTQFDLKVIHQENLGGAGGFHRGIKEAHQNNYKWIWVMDDDGIADPTCLQVLHQTAIDKNVWYVAPNLIDLNGNSHFAEKFNNSPLNYICDIGGPFNAILLKNDLIDQIGYPNENFYIWGDEYEYTDRIIEKGLVVLTVKNAIHIHKTTAFKNYRCPRPYYFIRNRFWRYRSVKGIFIKKRRLKYEAIDYSFRLFFSALSHLNLKQTKEVVRGVVDGVFKIF